MKPHTVYMFLKITKVSLLINKRLPDVLEVYQDQSWFILHGNKEDLSKTLLFYTEAKAAAVFHIQRFEAELQVEWRCVGKFISAVERNRCETIRK